MRVAYSAWVRHTTVLSWWLPAFGVLAACGNGGELTVDPETYVAALGQLRPGDTMRFMPGTYQECLEIDGLHGTDAAKITMTGPESGPPAILLPRPASDAEEIVFVEQGRPRQAAPQRRPRAAGRPETRSHLVAEEGPSSSCNHDGRTGERAPRERAGRVPATE